MELDGKPWTDAEVEHALQRLDETGIWLLANYGTARAAAFERGEWVVKVSRLTVSARRLATHYQLEGACSESRRRSLDRLYGDAILLTAGFEAIDDQRVRDMAGKLAPIDRSTFGSRELGEQAVLEALHALRGAGLICSVRSADSRDGFLLTDVGRMRMNETVYPAWQALARRASDWRSDDRAKDD